MNRAGRARPPSALQRAAWLEPTLTALALVMVGVQLVRLALQARGGVFATDECFHAYVAEWMLHEHRLPVEFPELYSGLFYYYPPLFHVLGALFAAVFGLDALHVFPVVLHAALIGFLATGAWGALSRRAGAWAALLCALSPTLTAYSVRLYVEGLPTLLTVLAAALLARVRIVRGWGGTLALGGVVALALLAKTTGLLVVIALLTCAASDAVRGERALAGRVGLAALIGVALAAPWFVRNQLLFGSALYPFGAPDLDRALYALNQARFSTPPAEFVAALPRIIGPWLGAAAVTGLAAAIARRRVTLAEGLMLAALGGMLTTGLAPMAAQRHLAPFLALLAFGAAWALDDLAREWRWAPAAVSAAMAGLMLHAVITLPDHRGPVDLPPNLRDSFPQVAANTPPDARILSLWTYDTFYYTRRAATWPNPWGQRVRPSREFTETDPARFAAELREDGITHVLVPMVSPPGPWDSANYPDSFARLLAGAVARGEARLAWISNTLALVRVVPADSLPRAR